MRKIVVAILCIAIFLMWLFPYTAFTRSAEYKNFKVFIRHPAGGNIENVLKTADLKLSRSEINNNEINHKIFICDNYNLYSFLAFVNFGPGARHAAGFTSVNNNIYIAMTDASNDFCFRSGDANAKRELSGLIAHEAIHNLILDKLGLIGYLKLRFNDTWKNEGYAEYIAFDGDMDLKKEIENLKGKWDDQSPKLMYLKYRLAVTYLMKKYNLTFEKLINNNYNFDKVILEIRAGENM